MQARKRGEEWAMILLYLRWHDMQDHPAKRFYDNYLQIGIFLLSSFKGYLIASSSGYYRAIVRGNINWIGEKYKEKIDNPKLIGARRWKCAVMPLTDDWLAAICGGSGSQNNSSTDSKIGATEESYEKFWPRFENDLRPEGLWTMVLFLIPYSWIQNSGLNNQQEQAIVIAGRQIIKSLPEGYFFHAFWSEYLGVFPGSPDEVRHKLEQGIALQAPWLPQAMMVENSGGGNKG